MTITVLIARPCGAEQDSGTAGKAGGGARRTRYVQTERAGTVGRGMGIVVLRVLFILLMALMGDVPSQKDSIIPGPSENAGCPFSKDYPTLG